MDALTFIAKLIEALAWPLAVVIVAWTLRTELRALLRLVKKVKAGPVEAEFDRELHFLRTETETEKPSTVVTPAIRAQTDSLLELAARHPRASILEAWRLIEFAMLRLANSRDLLPSIEKVAPHHVVRVISKERVLSNEELALYYDLRSLRNQAAHAVDFDPSETAAIDYIKLAQKLLDAIDQATKRAPKG